MRGLCISGSGICNAHLPADVLGKQARGGMCVVLGSDGGRLPATVTSPGDVTDMKDGLAIEPVSSGTDADEAADAANVGRDDCPYIASKCCTHD
ncbi:MAG: hypothetical protein JWQ24_1673 [Tardiphaga sp.]|nr:hypothetical protein [Tardiphaga sp.]